ncbi:MAG: DUF6438 domain-containing protein [Bacteroidia bacterium]
MKKLLLLLPAVALAVLMVGCDGSHGSGGDGGDSTHVDSTAMDTAKPAHDYANAVITLRRTPCFGRCPDYSLEVLGNGTVNYEGFNFVKVKGKQTSQVAAKDVKDLVDAFFAIDYFALPDTFTSNIEDVASKTTSISVDGKRKSIFENDGAPQSLRDLEDKIDKVANSAQWVSMPEEK